MSSETIADKLQISDDESLTIFNPPENDNGILDGLTQDISISDGDPADIVLAFIDDQKQLKRNLLNLKSNTRLNGSLWIVWQESGQEGEVNRGFLNDFTQLKGLKKMSETTIDENRKAYKFKINQS